MKFKKGFLFIFLAAALWSTTGVFSRALFSHGISPLAAGFWRTGLGTLVLFIYLIWRHRPLLAITFRDAVFFLGFGLMGVSLFNYFYLTTINHITVTGAAVLLHTAPAFAALLAYGFLKEPLTRRKVFCVLLALAGVFLVMEGYDRPAFRFNLMGILTGLGAALSYAGYSVFGRKAAVSDYHYWTVVFYSMLFGTLFLGIWALPRNLAIPFSFPVLANLLCFSLLTVVLAYGFYNRGLKEVEAAKASIVATSEVVMAVLWGTFLFKEKLVIWQVVGIFLVLGAALFIQLNSHRFNSPSPGKPT